MSIVAGLQCASTGEPSMHPMEVALVNTMPDAAFEDTERQFLGLLGAGGSNSSLGIRLYSIPDSRRNGVVQQILDDRYEDLDALYRRCPDIVIVTGTEPGCPDLRDEPFYERLSELIRWAQRSTSSVLLSCLAAHAALFAVDGVRRNRLGAKASGVYPQWVRSADPLTRGVGPVALPHSRLHDVPTEVMEAHGYTVLLASPEVGWTVATRDQGCLVVLVQGHPEYAPNSLLREYRRDVRRYLTGQLEHYPATPADYLDPVATCTLDSFRRAATIGRPDATLLEEFPFQTCVGRITADWRRPVEQLVGNWLAEVARRRTCPVPRMTR